MQSLASSPRRAIKGAVLSAFSFATVALLSGTALADSSVYLTNNTSKDIKVNVTSTLPSQHWKKKTTVIPAFSRKEVFETSRETGVTNGKTFTFTTEVLPLKPNNATFPQSPQPFALMLQLKGQLPGGHMWQSTRSQTGTLNGWHDDRKKYGTSMNVGQDQWNVTYWAYGTTGDDDVEYVIRENYPNPVGYGKSTTKEWKQNHLNVLSYNVYMRPTSLFVNGQSQRAEMIPPQLVGYDAVVFQEAFDDDARKILLDGMTKQGYKYHSKILGSDHGTTQDGGVIIVSRYPIAAGDQAEKLFGSACTGWDCSAEKGVVWVRINKKVGRTNNYFNVFGTHLNDGDWGVQKQQLGMIRSFIDKHAKNTEEAVIIAGDMNIQMGDTTHYDYMLDKLGAQYFTNGRLKGHEFTHDGPLNDLGDGGQSYIDYVLVSARHKKLITGGSSAEVRIPRALMEWKDLETETAMWDLSDHYAVYGNLHFETGLGFDPGFEKPGTLQKADQFCKADSDCPADLRFCDKSGPDPTIKAAPLRPARGATTAPRAGGRLTASAAKKPTITVKTGVCRIPPPK